MEAYGYLKDGEIVAPVAMCSRFNDIGAWHTLTDEERAVYGWYPCLVDNTPFNSSTQYKGSTKKELIDGVIHCTTPVFDKSLEAVRQETMQKIFDCVQLFKQVAITFKDCNFKLEDLSRLVELKGSSKEGVLVTCGIYVVKFTSKELNDLIQKLTKFQQKILTVQLEKQNMATLANTVGALVDIDPQHDLFTLLEN